MRCCFFQCEFFSLPNPVAASATGEVIERQSFVRNGHVLDCTFDNERLRAPWHGRGEQRGGRVAHFDSGVSSYDAGPEGRFAACSGGVKSSLA